MVQRLLFPPMAPTSSVAKGERIISLTSESNLYDMHENNAGFKMEYDETLKIQMSYPKSDDHWTAEREVYAPYTLSQSFICDESDTCTTTWTLNTIQVTPDERDLTHEYALIFIDA